MRQLNRSAFTIQIVQNLPVADDPVNPPVALPYIEVPNGFAVVIRAHQDNTGLVYIANNRENTTNPLKRCTIRANNAVKLYITNTNLVYAAGGIEGQAVELIVEG